MDKTVKFDGDTPMIILNDCRCWEDQKGITVDMRGTPNVWSATFEFNNETQEWEQCWEEELKN